MTVLIAFYFLLFSTLLLTSRSEPLLFLRLAFLGAPGAICSIAFWNGYFVSPHLQVAQTAETFRQAILLSAIGLLSARIGWSAGATLSRRVAPPASVYVLSDIGTRNLVAILFVGVTLWFAEGRGGSIINTSYAEGEVSGLPLGNFNAIINILIGTIVYFCIERKVGWRFWAVIIAIILAKVIYANLLRGIRADALDTILMIYVLLGIYNPKFRRINWKHLVSGMIFLIILQIIGVVRNSFYMSGMSDADIFSFLRDYNENKVMTISTIGDISATFLGYIWLSDIGYVIDMFRTYLGYILRIPPEFLYPDRPTDISWVFGEQGFTSGGGSFELGEAYLTLGVLGVAIVPAAISTVFSFLLNRLRRYPRSIVLFILLCSLLAVFSRGAWYQTFAYFKSFVTGIIWLIPLTWAAHLVPVRQSLVRHSHVLMGRSHRN